MRLARLTARVLPILLALVAAGPARAQEPVKAYTPAPRYSTFQLGAQVTGRDNRGRDVLLSWGRMRTIGAAGAGMPWLGLTAGFTSGRDVIAGVVAGPTVGFGYALPGQHMGFGRATRAEPYVLAQASAYGVGRFRGRLEAMEAGQEDGWGIAPAFSAGVGLRMFADEWDVDLTTLELVVEKRLGFGEDAAQLYIRFGRAIAPRERRDNGAAPGIAPAALPPPPPPASAEKPIPIPAPRGFLNPADTAALYAISNLAFSHPRLSGPYPRNLVVVVFQRDASAAERRSAIDLIRGELVGGDGTGYYVRITDDGTGNPLWSAIDRLRTLPQVYSAWPELFRLGLVPARAIAPTTPALTLAPARISGATACPLRPRHRPRECRDNGAAPGIAPAALLPPPPDAQRPAREEP